MLRPNIEYVLWSRTPLGLACLTCGLLYYWIRGHVTVIGPGHSQQAPLCLIDLLNNSYMFQCSVSFSFYLMSFCLTLRPSVFSKLNRIWCACSVAKCNLLSSHSLLLSVLIWCDVCIYFLLSSLLYF